LAGPGDEPEPEADGEDEAKPADASAGADDVDDEDEDEAAAAADDEDEDEPPFATCVASLARELELSADWKVGGRSGPAARLPSFYQAVLELVYAYYEAPGAASRALFAADAKPSVPTSGRSGSGSGTSPSPSPSFGADAKKMTKKEKKAKQKAKHGHRLSDKRLVSRSQPRSGSGSGSGSDGPPPSPPDWFGACKEVNGCLRAFVGWSAELGAVRALLKRAHLDLAGYNPTNKFAAIRRLNSNLHPDQVAEQLVDVLHPLLQPPASAAVFVATNGRGETTGEAVVELRSDCCYSACQAALRNVLELRADPANDLHVARPSMRTSGGNDDDWSTRVFNALLRHRMLSGSGSGSGVVGGVGGVGGGDADAPRPTGVIDAIDAVDAAIDADADADEDLTTSLKKAIWDIMGEDNLGPDDVAGELGAVGIGKFLHDLAPSPTGKAKQASGLFETLATGADGTLLLHDLVGHAVTLCRTAPARLAVALVNQGYTLSGKRYRWRSEEEWMLASAVGDDPVGSLAALGQLVCYMNMDIRRLNVSWRRYTAAELNLVGDELTLDCYSLLREVPVETLRSQAAFILRLNKGVAMLLPTVDFRGDRLDRSMAAVLGEARGLLLYQLKAERIIRLVNDTAQRHDSSGAPEITLDPLARLADAPRVADTYFVQAMLQLDTVDPTLLRVKMASGGDPAFPLEVRFTGERVDGTSGSFRDFLGTMAVEIRGGKVPLLMECPSAAVSRNVGRNILQPGPVSFPVAKMLEFAGQLLGIALRADIPFPLDALPSFWKNLAGTPLTLKDIAEADYATALALEKVGGAASADELATVLADCDGMIDERLLQLPPAPMKLPGGAQPPAPPTAGGGAAAAAVTTLTWATRDRYLRELTALRYQELQSSERMDAIRRGLQTMLPLDFLALMTWQDLEFKVCGSPEVNLAFLKANTTYASGLSESDPHIVCFWKALQRFTPEELQTFVKFACNQERIPSSCPPDSPAAPPFPMKIANPDVVDNPDGRLIRVETCMFMVKLPHYSTQEILTSQLLMAMNSRDDPLIG
jgi:hypothetical protein